MKKKEIRLEIATIATIKALEDFDKKHPGAYIKKDKLYPSIIHRAEWWMDDNDNYKAVLDIEAIPPPDTCYLRRNWRHIRKQAAKKYQKYIVWDSMHRTGTKLGTFEEFRLIPDILLDIVIGICDSEEDTAKIIQKIDPNADVYLIATQLKQLQPGK